MVFPEIKSAEKISALFLKQKQEKIYFAKSGCSGNVQVRPAFTFFR